MYLVLESRLPLPPLPCNLQTFSLSCLRRSPPSSSSFFYPTTINASFLISVQFPSSPYHRQDNNKPQGRVKKLEKYNRKKSDLEMTLEVGEKSFWWFPYIMRVRLIFTLILLMDVQGSEEVGDIWEWDCPHTLKSRKKNAEETKGEKTYSSHFLTARKKDALQYNCWVSILSESFSVKKSSWRFCSSLPFPAFFSLSEIDERVRRSLSKWEGEEAKDVKEQGKKAKHATRDWDFFILKKSGAFSHTRNIKMVFLYY